MKRIYFLAICFSFFISCKKSTFSTLEKNKICDAINANNLTAAEVELNTVISKINTSQSDQLQMEEVKKILSTIDCLSNVEIICVSCIYTLPAQSEIKMNVMINGQSQEIIADVVMKNPLALHFHK
jgi:hypothetical protein